MKRILCSIMLVLVAWTAYAQELCQYTKDSVVQTSAGSIYVVRAGDAYIHYTKVEPAYERFEPATSSDPSIIRNEKGFWNIDYSRFSKPSKIIVQNTLKLCFNQYLPILKPGIQGRG